MKKAVILLIVCVLETPALGCSLNDSLNISGINAGYSSNDTIKFAVGKHSSTTIVFSVGLQQKSEYTWVNVVDDIWRENSNKEVKTFMLRDSVHEIGISWTPQQRIALKKNYNILLKGNYRFLIKWHELNEPYYNSSYTESFKLR